MQQYSSLPEQNPQVDATPTLLTTIEQLKAELWLKTSLNQFQNRLNDCLVSALTLSKQPFVLEAELFQTVVNELNSCLNNCGVAIALTNPKEKHGKICYVSHCASHAQTVMDRHGKELALVLEQLIDIEDLQYLEKLQPPKVWQLSDDNNFQGWLIITTATKNSEQKFLAEFIWQAAHQCSQILIQLRKIQSLQQQCQNLDSFNQQLQRTNQLKNQFLANTSHEIRTPLSSILGFTHLLLAQGYDTSRARHQEYLNIIQSSGKHLLDLINDILDLSKVEADQMEMLWEKVNIPTLCKNVLALVKEKAANKGLQMRLEIDPNATNLVADPLRLKQMLLNLLFNALKFTNQGQVGLEVKSRGAFVCFTVWDTGTGISEQDQTQLFEPYFQVLNPGVNRDEGTGLGLAVTRKLAKIHGGWVEVESQPNRGSRFIIVLPRNQEDHTQQQQYESKLIDVKNLDQTKAAMLADSQINPDLDILLVEDDLPNAQMMQTYLEKLGYQVNWVKSATQMWEVLSKLYPDVILMDIQLREDNGLELVQQLRNKQEYQNIPIIVQTAMAMKGDRETCLAAGVDDYISKPIDLPLLATLVLKYSTPNS